MNTDTKYLRLLETVLSVAGELIETRNAKAYRIITWQERFTQTPLVSIRQTAWKSALREWEWFMSGSNDLKDLHHSVRPWWKPWADPDGRVPCNYSWQFRNWNGFFDQIKHLVEGITHHPFSRRNVITTWNTNEMASPACPITNCHGTVIQAFVDLGNRLHLATYQRSVDVICGLPHNWIQYWAFLLWLAYSSASKPGSLIWIGGDVHIYQKHEGLAQRMLNCERPYTLSPDLVYEPSGSTFRANDFRLDGLYAPIINERAEMIV
jgi:thymidylate synthase